MLSLHKLGIAIACTLFFGSLGAAQDPTGYRDFEFGMSVSAVAEHAQLEAAGARTIHTAPNLIQTLQWDSPGYFSSSADADPVRSIRFNFYDNQLFKIVATYGRRETEGMTADDLIDAISRVYGPPDRPNETVVITTSSGYEDRQAVVAEWARGDSVFDLYLSSFGGEFGLVGYSERLDALAATSTREAKRLDALAAPQREIDRQKKEADERRTREEAARSVNKPNFRP